MSRDAEQELWSSLGEYFAEDDGSLPELRLLGLPAHGPQAIFEHLSRYGDPRQGDQEFAPADLANLADRSNPPHCVFTRLAVDGCVIPDIGAGFFPDAVYLDYRMGEGWSPTSLAAFVRLVLTFRDAMTGSRLSLDDHSAAVSSNYLGAIERFANRL